MDNRLKKKRKIFVAMSGGVDSTVAALLLHKMGHEVTGVYMKNWSGNNLGISDDCPWKEDLATLDKVCAEIGIRYISYNFEKEYREEVINYFFSEYKKGRTPNPDVMCNSQVKFGHFLKHALNDGADLIATGHYAQIKFDGEYHLLKGRDSDKDQTYFLHGLSQGQLSRTVFPIGRFEKSMVREIAREFGLSNAGRKDSQGICFVGKIDVQQFLRDNISTKEGDIIDADSGSIVGKHDGVFFYTIGQRQGLRIGGLGEPYFVVDKDIDRNILFVAQGADNPRLFRREIELENIHFITREFPRSRQNSLRNTEIELNASIRYRQKPEKATLDIDGKILKFKRPIRAVSPGQSAVLYRGNECLGGGIIKK